MSKVSTTVNLLDDQFRLVTLHPGDTIPDWAAARFTNTDVIATDDDRGAEKPNVPQAPQTPQTPTEPAPVVAKYSKMKNAALVALLNERGLDATGKKDDMVARLEEADKAAESTEDDDVDLWSLNVDELKAFAEKHNIDVGDAASSEELATVISLAQQDD